MRRLAAFASATVGALLATACPGGPFRIADRRHDDTSTRDASAADGQSVPANDAALAPIGTSNNGGTVSGGSSSNGGSSGGTRNDGGIANGGGSPAAGGAVTGGTTSASGGKSAAGAGGSGGNMMQAGGRAATMDAGPPLGCTAPSDCPRSGTVCQKAACLDHQCSFVADPGATPVNARGDCRTIICSQSGTETILSDPTDVDDDNECTADSCQGSVGTHTPTMGARCKNATGFCDATGTCVGCLNDGECPGAASADECARPKCVHGACQTPAAGTLCEGGKHQCDGQGTCVNCWDSTVCGSCCFCQDEFCIQG